MKTRMHNNAGLLILLLTILGSHVHGQTNPIKLGAYYFDGWTGAYPQHLTPKLTGAFADRKPIWGWITSTQDIVDKQIVAASDAGLNFFSFCWYYAGKEEFKTEPLNNALKLFNKSKHSNKMQYCLLVANHGKYSIRDEGWNDVQEEWLRVFKTPNYLTVDNKPLLVIFSVPELIKGLGSVEAVKTRLQSLRAAAVAKGLNGVTIATCISPDNAGIKQAEDCGFDILTGYNYHGPAIRKGTSVTVPIDTMQTTERSLWSDIVLKSKLKYIPVSTLNWDPRPWAGPGNNYETANYLVGFSENSVFNSVSGMRDWMNNNPDKLVNEKLGLLYAWNENGEGAYLTPTEKDPNLLRGVKNAVENKPKQ